MLNAGGGWDPTILCDPKGGKYRDPADPTKGFSADSCNPFLESGKAQIGPFTAAPSAYSEDMNGTPVELYSSKQFLTEWGSKLLVLNGVDTTTNNHEVGNRVTWSGRTQDGQPALAALLAAMGSAG